MKVDGLLVYSGLRIADYPEPLVQSVKWKCDDCREPIWIDEQKVEYAIETCDERKCWQCTIKEVKQHAV